MSEDSIKSAEEQLHALINESNLVLTKMKSEYSAISTKLRRSINFLITVGAGIFITFLYSFIDVKSNMSKLESEKASKIELEAQLQKYSLKTSVIFFQNDIFDMNKLYYENRPNIDELQLELSYTKALREFNGDVTRGDKL